MEDSKNLHEYVRQGLFYKAVVEDGADIIFIVDYKGGILYHNTSVKETLGYDEDQLVGKNFFEFIEADALRDVKLNFEASTRKSYNDNIEFLFLSADGSYRYLEFNSINLKHKEGFEGLILDCRDISQRKKDAEELLRAQKAKEMFLANMSHEIRTPINGIAGMATLLFEAGNEDDRVKYLKAIKNSIENLKVIINDILDLSVIESGKLRFEKIGFNIKYQFESVNDTFGHQAQEKGIGLSYHLDPELDLVLLGDPVRLNQILINLISNAIKFTHAGEIKVHAQLKKAENNIYEVEFSVKDTGVGIPKDKIKSIFESFTQADTSVTRRYGGTGLGLTITRQLVELQNGTIFVESHENKGSTFTFTIPYEKGSEEHLIFLSRESEQSTRMMDHSHELKGVRVLLVEDHEVNRLYASSVLTKWQCKVDIAENGLNALELLKTKEYDLVLMDIQMPIMDGYEATHYIREKMEEPKRSVPIIALTANAIKGDNEKCLEAGMDDYLPKPFLPEDLFHLLLKYVLKQPIDAASVASTPAQMGSKEAELTDMDFLRKVCHNDEQFIKEMITTFIANTPAAINEMQNNLDHKNWLQIGHTAHKLKPSIDFMGVKVLKPLIVEIEKNSMEGTHLNELPTLINTFANIANKVLKELSVRLNANNFG
jgi:PAS domain S-box-containing protein